MQAEGFLLTKEKAVRDEHKVHVVAQRIELLEGAIKIRAPCRLSRRVPRHVRAHQQPLRRRRHGGLNRRSPQQRLPLVVLRLRQRTNRLGKLLRRGKSLLG